MFRSEERSSPFWFRLLIAFTLAVSVPTLRAAEPPTTAAESEPLKVLTIGNSFAQNATHYLPDLASSTGKNLLLGHADLPGASLEMHMRHVKAFENDPSSEEGRPFHNRKDPRTGETADLSLRDILESDDWDVVTIQQVSYLSFKPETYHPHVEELTAYIHHYAPTAEIVILQTWAYRQDHPMFSDGSLNQQMMYDGLRDAYNKLAASLDAGIIPIGTAFQLARQLPEWKLGPPDETFDFDHPTPGELPKDQGGLNRGWNWYTDRTTGKEKLGFDAIHANTAGCYLGAAVFYQSLFGEPVPDDAFVPEGLTAEQAKSLRQVAVEAIKQTPAARANHLKSESAK